MSELAARDAVSHLAAAAEPTDGVREAVERAIRRRQRRRTIGLGVSAIATASALVWAVMPQTSETPTRGGQKGPAALSAQRPGFLSSSDLVYAHATHAYETATFADWLRRADYVQVVRVVSEKEIAPAREEIERGEGLVGRLVTLRAVETLWARGNAAEPPAEFQISTAGWVFKGDPNDTQSRRRMAVSGESRLEVGHAYIVSRVWLPEGKCDEDGRDPARWTILSGESTLPYDDGRIGDGEVAGSSSKAEAPNENSPVVARAFAGRNASELKLALKAQTVPKEKAPARIESC